jgi:hypothetical protein
MGLSISINEDEGINIPGLLKIDNEGIKMPGLKIDDEGIKIPGLEIDDEGIKISGSTIDKNSIKTYNLKVSGDNILISNLDKNRYDVQSINRNHKITIASYEQKSNFMPYLIIGGGLLIAYVGFKNRSYK